MEDDMSDGGSATGQIKQKLVATKQRWAAEGRLLTGRPSHREEDRLPPGQRKVTDWPVLDLGVKPRIPLESWRLQIDGLVEQPMRLDWNALQALPQSDFTSDIHCVTAWSRFDNRWRGVAVRDLLDHVRPKAEARFVTIWSYDTYSTNLPLEGFAAEDALLATHWEGHTAHARSRRTGQGGGAAALLLEERQMGEADRVCRRGSAGLLGGARLPQSGRSVDRAALRISDLISGSSVSK